MEKRGAPRTLEIGAVSFQKTPYDYNEHASSDDSSNDHASSAAAARDHCTASSEQQQQREPAADSVVIDPVTESILARVAAETTEQIAVATDNSQLLEELEEARLARLMGKLDAHQEAVKARAETTAQDEDNPHGEAIYRSWLSKKQYEDALKEREAQKQFEAQAQVTRKQQEDREIHGFIEHLVLTWVSQTPQLLEELKLEREAEYERKLAADSLTEAMKRESQRQEMQRKAALQEKIRSDNMFASNDPLISQIRKEAVSRREQEAATAASQDEEELEFLMSRVSSLMETKAVKRNHTRSRGGGAHHHQHLQKQKQENYPQPLLDDDKENHASSAAACHSIDPSRQEEEGGELIPSDECAKLLEVIEMGLCDDDNTEHEGEYQHQRKKGLMALLAGIDTR